MLLVKCSKNPLRNPLNYCVNVITFVVLYFYQYQNIKTEKGARKSSFNRIYMQNLQSGDM